MSLQAQAASVAAKYGIPTPIFQGLVKQESGWNPNARSPAGASGLTQLMPSTARGLGVNLSDPVSQLDGGARYLLQQYKTFGSWKLALAAYNAGPGAVRHYGGIPPYAETQSYVKNILAGLGAHSMPTKGTEGRTGPQSAPQTGLNKQAFALDELQHLGNPGSTLDYAATGAFDNLIQPPSALPTQVITHRATYRAGRFMYPLGAVGKVIGVPYQGTHTMYGNWESDNAVDISAPKGTPVYAVHAGKIGTQLGALSTGGDPHLEGLRLHLITGGNEFYYAHLSKLLVKPGQTVKKGQLIGYSGEANGVQHLHIAAKRGNPLSFFRNPKGKA